jgi:hypothetical protein
MNTEQQNYPQRWLEHVRALAETIGPRPPTSEAERKGAEYCQGVMEGLNLQPAVESFISAKSIFDPHLYASIAYLVAFVIYPLSGKVSAGIAALITIIAITSELLELSFIDNPLRKLVPKAPSQNVIASVPPASEHRQDLILIGHIDSQVTPIIFSSKGWLKAYQLFTTVAFIAFILQGILYTIGFFTSWDWIWWATTPSAVCALLLAALCIHANRTPFTAGANDNATGAGIVLTMAEKLSQEPLQNTRVWLVNTGCEEVQHYGMIDFLKQHHAEFVNPTALVFETLGVVDPAWLTKEGIVVPFHATKELVNLAEHLAGENPDWGAHPASISGGNTEMADALRLKIPAITLMGISPKGEVPYWHQPEDTFDKMDITVMEHAYQFAWAFMQALDRQF